MREVCYWSRAGEIESREPVLDGSGKRTLRCPECGHDDHLDWLLKDAQRLLQEKVEGRQPLSA
jgi:transposase